MRSSCHRRGHGSAPPRDPRHESVREHGAWRVRPCTQGIRYHELVASLPVNAVRTSGSGVSGRRLIALSLLSCLMMSSHGSAFGSGVVHTSSSSSTTSSTSPFESETLSPRTVNTKYGSLRGILVSFRTTSTYARTSSTTRKAASVAASSSSTSQPPSSSSSSSSSTASKTKDVSAPSSSSVASNLRPVEVFMGVPYATPPVSSLRFMPPVTPTHWRGIRLANKFPAVCPQKLPDPDFPGDPSILRSSGRTSASSSSFSSSSKPTFSFTSNSYASMASLSSSSSSGAFSSSNQLPESRISHLKRVSAFLRNQSEDCLYLNVYAPFPSSSPPSSSSSSSSPRK